MGVQLILCFESSSNARTDQIYVYSTIEREYPYQNAEIKLSPVFMNGIGNYRNITNKINRLKNMYVELGNTTVIYFVDTDSIETNRNQRTLLKEIETYCENNKYELVWFCHDVEEVYLGHSVTKSEKVMKAKQFVRKNEICKVSKNMLYADKKGRRSSNILCILDKYFK